ncbi:unnamed protein product [Chrysoparadoxa australica]
MALQDEELLASLGSLLDSRNGQITELKTLLGQRTQQGALWKRRYEEAVRERDSALEKLDKALASSDKQKMEQKRLAKRLRDMKHVIQKVQEKQGASAEKRKQETLKTDLLFSSNMFEGEAAVGKSPPEAGTRPHKACHASSKPKGVLNQAPRCEAEVPGLASQAETVADQDLAVQQAQERTETELRTPQAAACAVRGSGRKRKLQMTDASRSKRTAEVVPKSKSMLERTDAERARRLSKEARGGNGKESSLEKRQDKAAQSAAKGAPKKKSTSSKSGWVAPSTDWKDGGLRLTPPNQAWPSTYDWDDPSAERARAKRREEVKLRRQQEQRDAAAKQKAGGKKRSNGKGKENMDDEDSDSDEESQKKPGEPTYKYHEVIRDKAKRAAMPGTSCEQCDAFMQMLYDAGDIDDKQKFLNKCSR